MLTQALRLLWVSPICCRWDVIHCMEPLGPLQKCWKAPWQILPGAAAHPLRMKLRPPTLSIATVFCHVQSIRHDLELECWLLLVKIVSYYIISYYILLYPIILYYIKLYHIKLYHIKLYHISQHYSTIFNLCWPVWLEATQSWVAAAAAARAPEVGLEQSCWKCHGKWNLSILNSMPIQ